MKINYRIGKSILMLMILLGTNLFLSAQDGKLNIPKNEYGLQVITKVEDYQKSIEIDSNNQLMNLGTFIPNLKADVRYATTNNFTKVAVYTNAKLYARLPVARALQHIQTKLNQLGLGLIVFDAYRPYSVTLKFWEIIKDENYAAAPWTGSRHNRGCAVDVSLYDLKTGKEIAMPTGFDDFTEKASPNYNNFSDEILQNRKLLIDMMKENGFTVYPTEWWHFDFKGYEKYNLMDIPFDNLD